MPISIDRFVVGIRSPGNRRVEARLAGIDGRSAVIVRAASLPPASGCGGVAIPSSAERRCACADDLTRLPLPRRGDIRFQKHCPDLRAFG